MEAQKFHILVVESDQRIGHSLQCFLKHGDYKVTWVRNSADALTVTNQTKPHLVLIAIELANSKSSGIIAAKAIYEIQPIPIIYLSKHPYSKYKHHLKATPFSHYFHKPSDNQRIEAAIDIALHNTFYQMAKADASNAQQLISLKYKGYQKEIAIENILWIQKFPNSDYIQIVTEQFPLNDLPVIWTSLRGFLQRYPHPTLVRIHGSYLVNKYKVDSLVKGGLVIIHQGEKKLLPIGKSFKKRLSQFFSPLLTI